MMAGAAAGATKAALKTANSTYKGDHAMPVDDTLLRQYLATIRDTASAALHLWDAPPPPEPVTVRLGPTDDVQKALNAATGSTRFLLRPGVYLPMTIPARPGTIVVVPDTAELGTRRMSPAGLAACIQFKPIDGVPAVQAEKGANALLGGFALSPVGDGHMAVCDFGGAGMVVCDQFLLQTAVTARGKRGILANCQSFALQRSYVAGLAFDEDSQAVAAWDGPQTFTITDCYLESSGENILLGGADSVSASTMPRQIRILDSTVMKPLAWRTRTGITVKNLVEVKCGIDVLIDSNLFDTTWADGQTGFGALFTVRNQDHRAPWSTVANWRFTNNVLRNCAAGIQILALDDERDISGQLYPSVRMVHGKVFNNLIYNIDPAKWKNPKTGEWGAGQLLAIFGGPQDIEVGYNTMVGQNLGMFLQLGNRTDQFKTEGLNLHHNILSEGAYGIKGDNTGEGRAALDVHAPGAILDQNVICAGAPPDRSITYGPGTNLRQAFTAFERDPLTTAQPTMMGVPVGCDRTKLSTALRTAAQV
jgi:hypothetical protein